MKIHLIHGIHTEEGESHVAKLIPYIADATGLDVVYHYYGYALAITSGILNPGRVRKISKEVNDGDICVGHSNGCAIIYGLMQKCNIGGAVLINAALEADFAFPNSFLKWVHIYYNENDQAVPWTEAPILDLIFDHSWGEMGRVGYKGKSDLRVASLDCGSQDLSLPLVSGHSDIFTPEKLRYWGPYIGRRIKHELDIAGT